MKKTSFTYLCFSLGCRTNQAEIESLSLKLNQIGFTNNPFEKKPDLVLLNTCVVTGKAEKETRKEIRKLRRLFPQSYLVIMGCFPQKIKKNQKDRTSFLGADLFIDNQEKANLKRIIEQKYYPHKTMIESGVSLSNKYIQSGRKFIKIQDGCNCCCTFCLTQLIRGKPQSVDSKQIVKEINFWVDQGVKEITLTGINVSLYGLGTKNNLCLLLKEILNKTTVERISFSSIYPEMLTKDFLDLVIKNKRILCSFHLSLQSGSETVLKRMKRKTDLNSLKSSINYLRKNIPEFTLRADFIVGFPQESEKEFKKTIELIGKLRISFVHVFPFSKRVGTIAYQNISLGKWKDFPEKLKKERLEKINNTVKKVYNREAIKQYQQVYPCLIVKQIPSLNSFEGITQNNWPIIIKKPKAKTSNIKGEILPIKIYGHNKNYLLGEIVSLPTKPRNTSGIITDPSSC